MGQNLFDKIQARLELLRLEKRYTRRRNRRTTFQSNAIYVDGEYVFQTPNTTGSSTDSSSASHTDALHGEMASPNGKKTTGVSFPSDDAPVDQDRLQRFKSMPSFGSTFGSKDRPRAPEHRASLFRP